MNVRNAAPLTAGLIFGWPSGLIAGLVGGIERWFSNAGDYTRLACTIGTIVAEGVVCISQTVAVRRMLPVGRYLRETLPLLAAGGVMFLAVRCLMHLLPVGLWPLMGCIGAGAAVYMLLVW
ncbi:MAG: polysaccharide biosynthesis C-terminal domain-containing protein, partial [Anaerotignum sp.]|nr:polysaccharide biosynthesis C-terminal domain-containing protein [Anaerotignum sp.]